MLAHTWEVVSLSPTELGTEPPPKESLFVFLGDVSPGVWENVPNESSGILRGSRISGLEKVVREGRPVNQALPASEEGQYSWDTGTGIAAIMRQFSASLL